MSSQFLRTNTEVKCFIFHLSSSSFFHLWVANVNIHNTNIYSIAVKLKICLRSYPREEYNSFHAKSAYSYRKLFLRKTDWNFVFKLKSLLWSPCITFLQIGALLVRE